MFTCVLEVTLKLFEKDITIDLNNETCVEEKAKRIRKVPCSDKILENFAKGRENR